MQCPKCHNDQCKVTDSRRTREGIRRRWYRCSACGTEFTTKEIYKEEHKRHGN